MNQSNQKHEVCPKCGNICLNTCHTPPQPPSKEEWEDRWDARFPLKEQYDYKSFIRTLLAEQELKIRKEYEK